MAMIETVDLTKRYGDLTAIDDIEFEVERGDIHGFVGPNGAGKTTTMQILVGLIDPTEGEAHVDGAPAGSIEAKRAIGYSPQDPTFYEDMSGLDYLEYMGRTAGMDGDVTARARELLDWLELASAADQAIGGYSGGMQRRLSLAQAMIHEPELLVLDEPTAALDPSGRRAIIDSLRDLADEGMTVFVSSHVLAELEQFIDTVTIIHDGEIVRTGPVAEIEAAFGGESYVVDTSDNETLVDALDTLESVNRTRIRDDGSVAVLTDDPDAFNAALNDIVVERDVQLRSLQQEGGLEEAFMDIVGEEDDHDGDASAAGREDDHDGDASAAGREDDGTASEDASREGGE